MRVRTIHKPNAQIIYTKSGRGLVKDAELLELLLKQNGWTVSLKPVPANSLIYRATYYWERIKIRLPSALRRFLDRCQMSVGRLRLGRFDLQIHLEIPFSTYLGACRENWLIPNQEWANMHQLQYLPHLSRILCKTQAAVDAYGSFNENVFYIGFSNTLASDLPAFRSDPERFQQFLHVAGNNQKKGSAAVIEAWRRNPQWPNLDFVVERPERFSPVPRNVTVWQSITDQQLEELRVKSGLVLAPSEVEGFGHVILEAMAWGSVTITTDAEPMNELVASDRGELALWCDKEQCRLGYRYYVSVDDLERVVNKVIVTSYMDLTELAKNARSWVEANHRQFEIEFRDQLATTGRKLQKYKCHC